MIHVIQRLELSILSLQDIPLEPPRRSLAGLVRDELLARHREDIVKFLERPLLGFRDEEENHHERADVQSGVETEGA